MYRESSLLLVAVVSVFVAFVSGCGSDSPSRADSAVADGPSRDSTRPDSGGTISDVAQPDSSSDVSELANRDGGSPSEAGSSGLDGRGPSDLDHYDVVGPDGGQTVDGKQADSGIGQIGDVAADQAADGASGVPDAGTADAPPSYGWVVPFAEGQKMYAIAQDATHIYWGGWYGRFGANGVYKAPKSGGTPISLAATALYTPGAVVVDSGTAYFITTGYGSVAPQLLKASTTPSNADGGTATLLVDGIGNGSSPLIMVAGLLYYTNQGDVGIGSYDTRTGATADIVDIKGQSPTDTGCGMAIGHNARIVSLASDGDYLYYYKWQSQGASVPLGPLSNTGWIMKVPIAGGAQTILTPGTADQCGTKATKLTNSSTSLRIVDGTLYWGAGDGNNYYKMSTQSAAVTKLLSYPNAESLSLAIDGPNVYFWCQDSLCRAPLAGGDSVRLLPSQDWGAVGAGNLDGLLVDDTYVYVIVASGQAIVRVAK